MTSKPIPLTVIGGYLGAGKTTLLNHVLHENDSRRLAVIVNDFGSINIDAELIESQNGDMINLANGCICCTLVDGFTTTLLNIGKLSSPPDYVVVEASGVADPYKLGMQGSLLGFQLDGIIVLIDAEQIRAKATDKYVGDTVIRQLKGADLLLLNKVDLVSPEQLVAVRAWLAELEPNTRIVETTHGRLPLTLLLGLHHDDRLTGDVPPVHDAHSRRHPGHDHEHQEAYQTWSFTWPEPLNNAAVRAFVADLPDGVLRAKGIVYLGDDPERRHLLQLVGKRWSLEPAEPWADQQPETRLVFIGLPGSIDEQHFKAALIAN